MATEPVDSLHQNVSRIANKEILCNSRPLKGIVMVHTALRGNYVSLTASEKSLGAKPKNCNKIGHE